jgi:hypothetical protein
MKLRKMNESHVTAAAYISAEIPVGRDHLVCWSKSAAFENIPVGIALILSEITICYFLNSWLDKREQFIMKTLKIAIHVTS